MPNSGKLHIGVNNEYCLNEKNTFLFDLLSHPVIIRDDQDIIQYCNPAFENLFGYSAKEVLSRLSFDFFVLKYFENSFFKSGHPHKAESDFSFFATLKISRLAKIKSFILLSYNLPGNSKLTLLIDHSEKIEYLHEIFRKNTQINTAFNSIPDIIFIFDENYIVQEINYKDGSYLLKPREELLNKQIDDLPLSADLIERTKKYLDIVFKTKESFDYEYSLSSEEIEHFFECRLIPSEGLVVAIIRDITENKIKEREIEDKQKKYKNLLEHIPHAVLEVCTNGNIIYKNQQYLDFLNHASFSDYENLKEIIGEEVFDFLIYNYTTNNENVSVFPIGGFFIEFRISDSRQFNDKKSYIILLNDVSENEKNKRALQESKDNYEILVETSPNGVIIRDLDNIYYANRKALEIFNISDINELNFSEYFSEDDLVNFKGRLTSVKNGIDVSYKEFRMTHPNRTEIIIETKPVYIQYGGKPAFQIVFRDISLQKKLQDERFEKELMLETNKSLRAEIDNRLIIEDELRNTLDQNTILIKEIHHRIKNNFQVISSLIKFTAKKFSDPALNKSFADINSRIKSMAIVHDFFYKSEDFSSVVISDYLHKIHRDFLRESGMNKGKELIEFKSVLNGTCIGIDDAITIGLIFNELMVICKYLHDNFTNKNCTFVELNRINSQKLELSLKLENENEIENRNLINQSDLSLIEVLIEQVNGEIEIDNLTGELNLKMELTKKI